MMTRRKDTAQTMNSESRNPVCRSPAEIRGIVQSIRQCGERKCDCLDRFRPGATQLAGRIEVRVARFLMIRASEYAKYE